MLTLSNIGRKIAGDRWIWRGVTASISPGEKIALAGPTGSGKTLLLRAIAGLDRVDEGSIALEGRTIEDWSMPEYRARVMLVPQIASLVEGTVEKNFRMPWEFAVHASGTFSRSRILEDLARFGRGNGFLESRAADLSGGERQIVSFLRAIQLDPLVLLLDEPTASLDPKQTQTLETLLAEWMAMRSERSVIWTSHRPEQLDRVTERRIELDGHDEVSE